MTVLFVIATIALFFVVDWLVHRGKVEPAIVPAAALAAPVRLPSGVFFARSHTWLNLFPSGRAWLGIDDFVTRLIEAPEIRYLKRSGERIRRGEPLIELAEGEHSLTIRSPLDGVLLVNNAALERRPDLLKRAPFADGWACEIRPDRYGDVKTLLLGDETSGWMQEEFGRLRDVLAGAGPEVSPAMLQDGGAPIAGAMRHVTAEVWQRFDHEFLEVR